MPEVSIALGTPNLGANHAVSRISVLDYTALGRGLEKTWPARPGVELGLRIK